MEKRTALVPKISTVGGRHYEDPLQIAHGAEEEAVADSDSLLKGVALSEGYVLTDALRNVQGSTSSMDAADRKSVV